MDRGTGATKRTGTTERTGATEYTGTTERTGASRPRVPSRWPRHLAAVHLSGLLLLCTFLVPPAWLLDAAYATPPGDATADAPFALLFAAPLFCVALHLLVQIPAGLLGVRAGDGRSSWVRYGCALLAAVPTSLLLCLVLVGESPAHALPAWGDAVVRVAIGLLGHVWVVRASAARPHATRAARSGSSRRG
ncbi:hypothetical protein [Streptomyces sp. NPDC047453]|uniref:hypothetical protein n=1 Tax=Streptomyces sp. NPDC047453 TaxID=3154812 RepID=UPI0033E02A4B